MAPKLQDIADARVNFQSQSGGGFGRDITIMLGSDDPELLETTAHQLVQEMEGIKEIRAPRLNGDLQRPEILRSEEHTSELQSLMRNSYAVFCFQKQKKRTTIS